MNNLRCNDCGKYIYTKDYDARVYTLYGNYCDLQPPDEEMVCGKCWNEMSEKSMKLLLRVCWRTPKKLNFRGDEK